MIRLADRTTADHAGAYVEHDRVDQAFRRLPFDQRTVLVLQHHFDLSHTEIADTLGIPLGTVKARIRYGSAALRASLDADDRQSWAASGGTSA